MKKRDRKRETKKEENKSHHDSLMTQLKSCCPLISIALKYCHLACKETDYFINMSRRTKYRKDKHKIFCFFFFSYPFRFCNVRKSFALRRYKEFQYITHRNTRKVPFRSKANRILFLNESPGDKSQHSFRVITLRPYVNYIAPYDFHIDFIAYVYNFT